MTQLPPEGLSQSAWDEADLLSTYVYNAFHNDDGDWGDPGPREIIARAIMAATAAERERCALIAENAPQRQRVSQDGSVAFGTREQYPWEIAAAIRQGSQPSNAISLKGVVR